MKLLLRFTLCCIFVLAALAESHSAPLSPPERADLLNRLEALRTKYPSMEANFSEQRGSHLLKKPVTSNGTIAFQSPNKFRREVTGANPSLTVSDGRHLWIYYPNFKEAEEYTLGQRAMFDDALAAITAGLNFGRVETFYSIEAAREPGGGYLMVLTPKKGNLRRVLAQLAVFLDKELNVTRTDLTLPKGDHIVTTYSNPRHTPLPASTFEFVQAPGVHVTHPLGK